MLRARAVLLAAIAAGAAHPAVHAEGLDGWSGPFQLQLRAVYLEPQSSGSGSAPQLHLDGGWYGELSAAWFMTQVLSMELSLGQVGSFHSSIASGAGGLSSGSLRVMPNTWTLRYDFAPGSELRPYLGLGLHYTVLSVIPAAGNPPFTVESSQLGWVLQAGAELHLVAGWFCNADIRYLGGLDPDMTLYGRPASFTGHINPLLLGAGVGLRW